MKKEYKEGVDFVFEQNPKLAKLGTKEDYSKYIKTIFPESKVKDIVYHGSDERFYNFNKQKLGTSTHKDVIKTVGGFFFSEDKSEVEQREWGKIIYPVLLNLKNPKADHSKIIYGEKPSSEYDGLHSMGATTPARFVAFEPSQIHILGSKKDLKGFEKYVKSKSKKTQKGNSLEDKLISGAFIAFFIAGLFFISPSLTGNVISPSNILISNISGVALILGGTIGFFIYKKYYKKK